MADAGGGTKRTLEGDVKAAPDPKARKRQEAVCCPVVYGSIAFWLGAAPRGRRLRTDGISDGSRTGASARRRGPRGTSRRRRDVAAPPRRRHGCMESPRAVEISVRTGPRRTFGDTWAVTDSAAFATAYATPPAHPD